MSTHAVIDGTTHPIDEATVNVRDRGFRYGDAAFETMRVYAGQLFAWPPHADRLNATCEALSLDHGLERSTLRDWIEQAISANDLEEGAVRLSITRGIQPGTIEPQSTVDPTVVVTVRPLERGGRVGPGTWDGPAVVEPVDTRRVPDASIPSHAKTHNYLNGILARAELSPDADEALVRDGEGHVVEGTTSNLFVVNDGVLVTPPRSDPVLPGVTRAGVIALAEGLDVPVERRSLDLRSVREADEAFLTNTTWEVRPIGRVGSVSVGSGPVTERLKRAFDGVIEATFYA